MHYNRSFKIIVGLCALAGLLSACSGPANDTASSGQDVVTVAEVNGFSSLNPKVASSNVDINAKVAYLSSSGFTYVNPDNEVVANEKFGKVEKLSDSPLTVKYTLSDQAKWSDGVPVTADDMILSWAASSSYYDSRKGKNGTQYFQPAVDTSGLRTTDFPEIGDDNKSITIKYSRPFADWELVFGVQNDGGLGPAAHIVAKKTGIGDATALTKLLKDIPKGNPDSPAAADEKLRSVAKFWNEAYHTKQTPSDEDLLVNNGAYKVTEIVPEQSVTLEKNPDFSSGPEPSIEKVVVRTIGTASAQVQALRNGDVDIISPQPSMDTVSQLKEVQGIKFEEIKGLAYDHIDLTFGGVFADKNIREAFLKTIPRQEVINRIVKPLDPQASPMDSQLFYPGEEEEYRKAIKNNGSGRYADVDIEGAKRLLAGQRPTVRVVYNKDNQNRVDTFLLVQESAAKAGFKVVDAGLSKTDWGKALGNGSYDAAIFGWIMGSGPNVSESAGIFMSMGGTNYNKFADDTVDGIFSELIETVDEDKKVQLKNQADKAVFDAAYGLPLFNNIVVTAYSDRLSGISSNAIATSFFWNFWDWKVEH